MLNFKRIISKQNLNSSSKTKKFSFEVSFGENLRS